MKKVRGKKDNIVVLKGISASQIILAQYAKKGRPIVIEDDDDQFPLTIVDVDQEDKDISVVDLMHEKSKRAYYFLDVRKIQIKLWPNMIDTNILPLSTTRPCWWCRHTFTNRPIGCPIRYHHRGYTTGPSTLKPITNSDSFFETEGYFCSFPCCKAYIIDNSKSVKYKESLALLSLLFKMMYDKLDDIPIAPTWKILKEYGGHLTIQEYRSAIGRLEYEETINSKRMAEIRMYPNFQYISEKKIKMMGADSYNSR